jgi:3D (Asp-Asp-Asp) domain-containing protein
MRVPTAIRRSLSPLATLAVLVAISTAVVVGCRSGVAGAGGGRVVKMEVTAYCACQKCCSWTYNAQKQPVFASGRNKGKVKRIGITADGSRVRHGTVAADIRHYPFGVVMHVPGYGTGVVHDTGGAIRGARRLDLFFPTHEAALQWGRQTVLVTVFD